MINISVAEFIVWVLVGNVIGLLIALPVIYIVAKRTLK